MIANIPNQILDKARKIKLLILDVDGILTDGRIYYGNYGDELKAFDVKDGFGIALLRQAGIDTAIITAKKSKIVRLRAQDIGVRQIYESHTKIKVYEKILKKTGITDEQACFAGDDILDIPVLKRVGLAVTTPCAGEEVKRSVSYITQARAGRGAVRELCEFILKSQDKWAEVTAKYFI